jgi:hypothetical protein
MKNKKARFEIVMFKSLNVANCYMKTIKASLKSLSKIIPVKIAMNYNIWQQNLPCKQAFDCKKKFYEQLFNINQSFLRKI